MTERRHVDPSLDHDLPSQGMKASKLMSLSHKGDWKVIDSYNTKGLLFACGPKGKT